MKPDTVFLLVFLVISLLSCNQESKKANRHKPPNIVFIMSDDHAYQAISAYSDKLIETPNIDRIAKEGMLFTNASVTNSICAPSRAVILTGKHSHINGKIDNQSPFDTTNVTFPQLLQKPDTKLPCLANFISATILKALMNLKFFRGKAIITIRFLIPKRAILPLQVM